MSSRPPRAAAAQARIISQQLAALGVDDPTDSSSRPAKRAKRDHSTSSTTTMKTQTKGKGKGKGKGKKGKEKATAPSPSRPHQPLPLPDELIIKVLLATATTDSVADTTIPDSSPTFPHADPDNTHLHLYNVSITCIGLHRLLRSTAALPVWSRIAMARERRAAEDEDEPYLEDGMVEGVEGFNWGTFEGENLLELKSTNFHTILCDSLAHNVYQDNQHPRSAASTLIADVKLGKRVSTGNERKKLEDDVVAKIVSLRAKLDTQVVKKVEDQYRKSSPELFDAKTGKHRVDAPPSRPSQHLCSVSNWPPVQGSSRAESVQPAHLRTAQTDLDWVATGIISSKLPVHDAIPHLFSNTESGRDPAKFYYTAEGYQTVGLMNDTVLELAVDEGTVVSSYGKEILDLVLNSRSLVVVPVPVAGLWRTTDDELKPVEIMVFHLRRKDEPHGRGTILVHHHAPALFSGGHSRLDQVWYQDAAVAALSFLAPVGAELPTPDHYYERAYSHIAQDEDAAAQIAIAIGQIATAEVERGEPLKPSERTRLFPLGDRFLRRWLRKNAASFESAQLRLASGETVRPWWLPSSLVASEAQLAKLVMLERGAATRRERRAAALANGELYGPDLHAANLEAARAKGKLYGLDLRAANLEAARLKGELVGPDLMRAKLEAARLEGELVGPDLRAAKLEAARLEGKLVGPDLAAARLEAARLEGELVGPDLTRANLEAARLEGKLAGYDLRAAKLEAARLEGKVAGYDLQRANAQRRRDEIFVALSPSSASIVRLDGVVDSGDRISTLGAFAVRQLCLEVGLAVYFKVEGRVEKARSEELSGWLEAVRAEVHGRSVRGPCADGDEPAQTLVARIERDELERRRQRAQEAAQQAVPQAVQQEAPVVRRSGRARAAKKHDDDD
ncbi:hypothetical protein JCM3775_000062 [Rhodotorula graminis]